jgi:hypothetical protein
MAKEEEGKNLHALNADPSPKLVSFQSKAKERPRNIGSLKHLLENSLENISSRKDHTS